MEDSSIQKLVTDTNITRDDTLKVPEIQTTEQSVIGTFLKHF